MNADKAMKAASSMSLEQLNLIGHIWSDWSLVLTAYGVNQFSPQLDSDEPTQPQSISASDSRTT